MMTYSKGARSVGMLMTGILRSLGFRNTFWISRSVAWDVPLILAVLHRDDGTPNWNPY